jgi:AraC-like DNA-binding protein
MPPPTPAGPRHQLGGYREFPPPPALAAVAESVWIHRAPAAGMHRVLPDPALNLAFRCRRLSDGRAAAPRLAVIGPKRRPFPFRFGPGDEIAAVKVKLEWARPLLQLTPAEHFDREDTLSPEDAGLEPCLLDRLAAAPSAEAAAVLLAAALIDAARRAERRAPGPAAQALDLVRRTTGRVTVLDVASRVRLSLRQLHRAVRGEAGVSLKGYARVTRFNHAMAAADRADRPAWARVAAETGFCDQSHLVRECRALAGLPPVRVHRERRAEAETSNRG